MKDKELLLEAITNYDLYSSSYKKVLITLITVSIDNVAALSVKSIHKATHIAQNTIYIILRALENDGIITRRSKIGTRNAYKINQTKLDEILEIYQRKQLILKNNQ
jgi:transposase